MKKELVNFENKKIKDIDINDNVWGAKVLPDIIHQYIRYQNAKSRQGSHKTKNRSEVNGRAKKPFAQKGTGNARQGSSKPPHYRGGATSMGPQNRDHSFSLNKKEKTLALKCALSAKSNNEEIISSEPISNATEAGKLKNILSSNALFWISKILFFFFKNTCLESCGKTTTPIAIPAIARLI